MTDEDFDKRLQTIEDRSKRAISMAVSLILALFTACAAVTVAYHSLRDSVEDNTAKIIDTNAHLDVTDNRVDNTPKAPPPNPLIAVESKVMQQQETK